MTIHAAKGLQFPVVFVPYLNKENAKNPADMYLDSELGLALKPAACGTESSLLYDLLRQRQKQKEAAEAKRLFYTAVTRAGCCLYLSAQLKNEKVKPNSALDWMRGVFNNLLETDRIQIGPSEQADKTTPERTAPFELHIVRRLEETAYREGGYQAFIKGMQGVQEALPGQLDKPAALPAYLQKIPPGSGSRVFSPTRLMVFQKDKQEYYRRYHLGFFDDDYETFAEDIQQDEYGLLKGKIVHRYLELMPQAVISDRQLIEQILFEFEVFDAALQRRFFEELLQIREQVTQSETARRIVYADEAQNEAGITIRLGKDYLTGTLDRIFRNEAGNREVADYKTNRISAAQVKQESGRYELQMQAYALLLSKIYPGQPEYPVSLYFLHPDTLFTKRFTPAELTEVEADFNKIIQQIKKEFPVK